VARLYADENFPLPVVEELRTLGRDVVTLQEDGKAYQRFPDDEVLAAAHADQRILLTLNRRHFIELHRQSSNHSGIIVCTYDPNSVAQAARIDIALHQLDSLDGRLIRINRPASLSM
jgi:predicted nuclease of predicted toxin-antitoxin system